MYYITKKKGDFTYASAAKSIREGKKTRIDYTYLGRVVDLEKGIFYSQERQYFAFDISTGLYGKVDESFEPPAVNDKRRFIRRAMDFGDTYLLDQILWKSGFWEVVDELKWANKETLHTMVLFYIVSMLPNKDACMWYEGNIVSKLYPKANMSSESISDFLEKIGRADSLIAYHETYIKFVFDNYSKDKNILIDSMGLPNKSRVFLTQLNVHNNKINVESRLVIVAQKHTGIQLYFYLMPGNINDGMSLKTVFEHCSALGIDVDGCLLDAGYSSDINLDEFYNENHECIHDYITRPKSTADYYRNALLDTIETLKNRENFVQFEDRYLYLKCVEVMVGKQKNQPAYLYIGLDENRLSDELHKLLKRAKKKKLTIEDVYSGIESQGIFSLLSGKEYGVEEVLPEYYVRQGIEQLNDIAKNYTKLLPIRSQKQETYTGHVILSMVAAAAVRFIQLHLNDSDLYLGTRLESLRNQKAILYNEKIVPDPPIQPANEMYSAFGIPVPVKLDCKDQVLQVQRPKKVTHYFKTPKKRIHRAVSLKKAEPSPQSETEKNTSVFTDQQAQKNASVATED